MKEYYNNIFHVKLTIPDHWGWSEKLNNVEFCLYNTNNLNDNPSSVTMIIVNNSRKNTIRQVLNRTKYDVKHYLNDFVLLNYNIISKDEGEIIYEGNKESRFIFIQHIYHRDGKILCFTGCSLKEREKEFSEDVMATISSICMDMENETV